ncbi:MAG: repeat protein [Phenylobacterium sp.]|nr:repeat protein [Phenylobacterium sp.]
MPYSPVDPASLEGDDLTTWYLRSPEEIEQARQVAQAQAYNDFFSRSQSMPASEEGYPASPDDDSSGQDPSVPNAPALGQKSGPNGFDPSLIDRSGAGPGDGGALTLIGNPANPRLRRAWEQREGRPWPQDETGRNYDVAHIKALADGGTNTLENIRPMHPEPHAAEHMANGDHARWAKRPWIARAFGGKVGTVVGPLSWMSDLTGILSGRIRTNSTDNFVSDMLGWPSQEDQRRAYEAYQKAINPKWKPGDPDGV